MIGELDSDESRKRIQTQKLPPGGSGVDHFTADEMKKLRDLLGKFPSIEEMLQKLLNDLKGLNIQQLRDQIQDISACLEETINKEQFDMLSQEVEDLKDRVRKNEMDI